jgi:hypothetical protein
VNTQTVRFGFAEELLFKALFIRELLENLIINLDTFHLFFIIE